MLKLTKRLKPFNLPCLNTCTVLKDLTFAHLLFTASCSNMNSPVNQTNRIFLKNSFFSQFILFNNTRRNILQSRMGSLSNHEDDGSVEMSPKMTCVLSNSIAFI